MEKILITYSPQGKDIASKIQLNLKKEGYSCTLGAPRVDVDKKLPDLVIAVFASDSESDSNMIKVLGGCSERNISVVPFVSCDMAKTVSQNYFLDEHVWIDNNSGNFEESVSNLVDLLKNNYSELSKRTPKKVQENKQSNNKKTKETASNNSSDLDNKVKLYKNLLYLFGAIIIVLVFILINGGLNQTNREADNYRANSAAGNGVNNIAKIQLSDDLKGSEKVLVGTWKMSNYSDNRYRATRQDSLELQALVNALISRAQLVFNPDKTFRRIGFSDTDETGVWEYDPSAKYLKLQPTNVNQYDVVQIQELNDNRLIIVVQEKVDGKDVFTQISFTKER